MIIVAAWWSCYVTVIMHTAPDGVNGGGWRGLNSFIFWSRYGWIIWFNLQSLYQMCTHLRHNCGLILFCLVEVPFRYSYALRLYTALLGGWVGRILEKSKCCLPHRWVEWWNRGFIRTWLRQNRACSWEITRLCDLFSQGWAVRADLPLHSGGWWATNHLLKSPLQHMLT